jgi:hypothetical protein
MELKSVPPWTPTSLEAGSAWTLVPGRPVSMAFLIVTAQWPQVMSSNRIALLLVVLPSAVVHAVLIYLLLGRN